LALSSGYTDPRSFACFMRATELSQEVGEEVKFFPAIFGVWMMTWVGGNLPKAMELAQQLLRIAEGADDSILLMAACCAVLLVLEVSGDVRGALHYAERILAQKPVANSILVSRFLHDPIYQARWTQFRCLWLMGFPDRARAEVETMLALMERDRIAPRTAVLSLGSVGSFFQWCRDTAGTKRAIDKAKPFTLQHDLPFESQWIRFQEGWTLAREGSREAGLAKMREVLKSVDVQMYNGTDAPALFAEELVAAGQEDEAWEALERALEFANRTGHRFSEAELHRLKGEILKRRGDPEAERCFRQAVEIGQRSGALSVELRALLGLARWLQDQGRGPEVRQELERVYGLFTEGFDTPDLKLAEQVLRDLGGARS
jgi:tetratricopeptide (TPR) repeat protein